jgi:hypothetical protein
MATKDYANRSLDCALGYGARGWLVYPAHTIRDGWCSCGDAACGHPGKHPIGFLVPHGFRDATTAEHVIRGWFNDRDWNVGIATGQVSSFVVLDHDPRHGGDQSLEQLELPATVEAVTGGGGRHLYFRYPDTPIGTRAGIAPGLDLCGDGGSVIAPPSRHASGGTYTWRQACSPDEVALAPFPEALRVLSHAASWRRREAAVGERIPNGQRHTTLVSLAGSMRRRGMTESEILAALRVVNEQRCIPPLPESEVVGIAHSVARYAPTSRQVDDDKFDEAVWAALRRRS